MNANVTRVNLFPFSNGQQNRIHEIPVFDLVFNGIYYKEMNILIQATVYV